MTVTINPPQPIVIQYEDEKHKYTVNGEVYPSVTTILDATLPKPALVWWAFRIGLAAAVELLRNGALSLGEVIAGHDDFDRIVAGDPSLLHGVEAKGKLKTLIELRALIHRLDPNHVKKKAGQRGTGIHDALAVLIAGGVPDISEMPDSHRPFCSALLRWWQEQEPDVELTEQPVASLTHRFAGRFDALVREDDGSLTLIDLKTSKAVREDSYYRQLQAYKIAWEESGGEPISRMKIVLCKPSGDYAVYDATNKVVPNSFLACVAQFAAIEEFKALNRKRSTRKPKD